MSVRNDLLGGVDWSDGEVLEAVDLNDTINEVADRVNNRISPIGSIQAWHKDLNNVPSSLPGEWVECNGQTISDSDSPLDGVTLPDLNGEERFLRGNSTSGTLQSDQLGSHDHTLRLGEFSDLGNHFDSSRAAGSQSSLSSSNQTERNEPIENTGGNETRPINMSVVWIIRVK